MYALTVLAALAWVGIPSGVSLGATAFVVPKAAKMSGFGSLPMMSDKNSVFSRPLARPNSRPLLLASSLNDSSNSSQGSLLHRLSILERPHERTLFLFYGIATSAFLYASGTGGNLLLQAAEAGVALTWATMILAVSFTEAWVKFKAPFLKKWVAVDVGRHVFAALNSIELALAGSFWLGRLRQCCCLATSSKASSKAISSVFWKDAAFYSQPHFFLPAIATLALIAQVFLISPVLFLQAKSRISISIAEGPCSGKELLTKAEQIELASIDQDLKAHPKRGKKSNLWHKAYALLEVVKLVCLPGFAAISWMNLLT